MSTEGQVSVVIPAFNVEGWLPIAIRSALSQSPAPIEVVVVDDGSTDGTAAVAESMSPTIKLVRRPHGGVAAARNTGVEEATGDLILFLDADDQLLPGALDNLILLHDRYPGAGAYIPNHNELVPESARLSWPSWPEPKLISREDLRGLLRRNWLRANCLVPRRVAIETRFDERFPAMEDLLFFTQLLHAGRTLVVSGKPGVDMRVRREGSLTAQVAFMRRSRRLVFEAMLVEMDLSPVENATLHYGLVRTSVGEVLALRPDRAAMGDAISAQEESPSGTVRTMATIERLLLR